MLSMLMLMTLVASVSIAQGPATFHAETRLVVVQMTVHDSGGQAVTNLDRGVFKVYENGKPQPIALFLGDNVPVSLGIVIDNSGSMRARRTEVESAALTFAGASNPRDEMFVVNFADTPHVDVPLTSDIQALDAGIARVDSIGGTALFDAVDLAERYLNDRAKQDRRALLVITDGNDNASTTRVERVRKLAEQSNIAIYVIGLPHDNASRARHARRELDDLTEGTGGMAVHVEKMEEVGAAALDIAHQIRHQYTLAYAPLNQTLDGSYRKIRVVVQSHERLSVRTRAGYFATASYPAVPRPD